MSYCLEQKGRRDLCSGLWRLFLAIVQPVRLSAAMAFRAVFWAYYLRVWAGMGIGVETSDGRVRIKDVNDSYSFKDCNLPCGMVSLVRFNSYKCL